MTREQIYKECTQKIAISNCLLMELSTGVGKTKMSIDLTNHILKSKRYKQAGKISMLILVAKRVHKQTWEEEIRKWGGFNHPTASINIRMECYESLHKCTDVKYDILISDEVHHIGSEARLELLKNISFSYFIGLSATIPEKLKRYFLYRYHSQTVSCNINEAIEDSILPEPKIILFPLMLDIRKPTETWEINSKAPGKVVQGEYKDFWKLKKQKIHAIISMTQKQKLLEYNKLIEWEKDMYMRTRREPLKQSWLYHAGKRLEYLSTIKLPIVLDILHCLSSSRTITFCKTIDQAELCSPYCIHSKNNRSNYIYRQFNSKRINHISAVNILNENANLVDCKYAVFCNLSSSDISVPQRLGRALRHKSPVIIIPYYADTREEELAKDMTTGFNNVITVHSITEIITNS